MFNSIMAISAGASIGAIGRWLLGIGLNSYLPTMPLGTLVANLIGGYLVGIALVFFTNMPTLTPEWRLFIITGFLGALTTFSSFSAEVITLLQQQKIGWALVVISSHVIGSLIMTTAGFATATYFQK